MVKVKVRGIMGFLPRKMAEGMKRLDETIVLANKKYGPLPDVKNYAPWIGGGNAMNTVAIEMEWDSFTQMAEFSEKACRILR